MWWSEREEKQNHATSEKPGEESISRRCRISIRIAEVHRDEAAD